MLHSYSVSAAFVRTLSTARVTARNAPGETQYSGVLADLPPSISASVNAPVATSAARW